MWPQVLLPEHLISGFRAAGLHPLKWNVNTDESKLKISVPFQLLTSQLQSLEGTASSSPSQSQSRQSLEGTASSLPSQSQSQQSLLAERPVTVASPLPPQNQPPEPKNPVTLQIAKYFGNIFIQNSASKVTVHQRGDRVEPRHYWEGDEEAVPSRDCNCEVSSWNGTEIFSLDSSVLTFHLSGCNPAARNPLMRCSGSSTWGHILATRLGKTYLVTFVPMVSILYFLRTCDHTCFVDTFFHLDPWMQMVQRSNLVTLFDSCISDRNQVHLHWMYRAENLKASSSKVL